MRYHARVDSTPASKHVRTPRRYVGIDEYAELLRRLAQRACAFQPRPDCVIGDKRSGLFPAVYISHQLELPIILGSELKNFPIQRLRTPLLVDTTAWNGRSLRRMIARLRRAGVRCYHPLVMFARAQPRPNVHGLHCLEHVPSIVHFWYEDETDMNLNNAGV